MAERLTLELATPSRLVVGAEVDEVVVPGSEGYFGVRPGHTPMMASLGIGELSYRKESGWHRLTCFSGWCEVRPDRVNVLADIGERAEDIDVGRAEQAAKRAAERMKAIRDEAGYEDVHAAYVRAVTRLAVARKERGGG